MFCVPCGVCASGCPSGQEHRKCPSGCQCPVHFCLLPRAAVIWARAGRPHSDTALCAGGYGSNPRLASLRYSRSLSGVRCRTFRPVLKGAVPGPSHVSRFGLAVRRYASKRKDLGSIPLRLSFLFKKVVVCGHCLVTLSITSY